jgi:hypothetical protein
VDTRIGVIGYGYRGPNLVRNLLGAASRSLAPNRERAAT